MDRRGRELERAGAEGDRDAQAALLLERLRRGELPLERLRLAAFLGHEPARVALGEDAPSPPGELAEWGAALGAWGPEVAGRALYALALRDLPRSEVRWEDRFLRMAADTLRAWVRAPGRTEAELLEQGAELAGFAGEAPTPTGLAPERARLAALLRAAARLAAGGDGAHELRDACGGQEPAGGREALAFVLLPWALVGEERLIERLPGCRFALPARLPAPWERVVLNPRQRDRLERALAHAHPVRALEHQSWAGVSRRTARRDLERLVAGGILVRERPGQYVFVPGAREALGRVVADGPYE
ncbi:MAG: hypothetical protein AB7N76_12430 [Planctomycetota bacterium]